MADGRTRVSPPAPVTLNLFQGPFRGLTGAWGCKLWGGVDGKSEITGRAAQWVLKRVQDDENCGAIS